MADEFIDHLFKDSEKAEFLEACQQALTRYDKAVIVFVRDTPSGFTSRTMELGVHRSYEALGILEIGKSDTVEADLGRVSKPENDPDSDSAVSE